MAMVFKFATQLRELKLTPAGQQLDLAIKWPGGIEGVALSKDEARHIAETMLAWADR